MTERRLRSLSIEGDWGSGKSSFMRQLRTALTRTAKESSADKDEPTAPLTVWFNAWRHDKGEALWAAFALKFLDDVSASLTLGERFRAAGRLLNSRYDWKAAWWDITRAVIHSILWVLVSLSLLIALVFVVPAIEFIRKHYGEAKGIAAGVTLAITGVLSFVASARTAFNRTKQVLGNPLRYDLRKHLRTLDYVEKVAFIEKFHQDFSKMVKAYAASRRVFVFIDDLDRCEITTAAELLQAINLMIGDDAPIVFILGLDRFKVAAGLAARAEKVLPYLQARSHSSIDGKVNPVDALEYGLSFMDKFIQLPFKVPIPSERDLQTFLAALRGEGQPHADRSQRAESFQVFAEPGKGKTRALDADFFGQGVDSDDLTQGEGLAARWDGFELKVARDSDTMQELVRMVAPLLDFNPRRLKQFINSFRLKAYICFDTGLFNPPISQRDRPLSFEALGKFVALTLRWPMLIDDLEKEPLLFHLIGRDETSALASYWENQRGFRELLTWDASPHAGDDQTDSRFSLSGMDVLALLKTSPRVQLRFAQASTVASDSGPTLAGTAVFFEQGFRPIAGTTSPNGRYALGWAPNEPIAIGAIKELEDGTYGLFDENLVVNNIVDLQEKRLLKRTRGKHWGDRASYSHRTCSAYWSARSDLLIELHDGKWGTLIASAFALAEDEVGDEVDLLSLITDYANRELANSPISKHRLQLSIGLHDLEMFNDSSVKLRVSGYLPKSGPGFDANAELLIRRTGRTTIEAEIFDFSLTEYLPDLKTDESEVR